MTVNDVVPAMPPPPGKRCFLREGLALQGVALNSYDDDDDDDDDDDHDDDDDDDGDGDDGDGCFWRACMSARIRFS